MAFVLHPVAILARHIPDMCISHAVLPDLARGLPPAISLSLPGLINLPQKGQQ